MINKRKRALLVGGTCRERGAAEPSGREERVAHTERADAKALDAGNETDAGRGRLRRAVDDERSNAISQRRGKARQVAANQLAPDDRRP